MSTRILILTAFVLMAGCTKMPSVPSSGSLPREVSDVMTDFYNGYNFTNTGLAMEDAFDMVMDALVEPDPSGISYLFEYRTTDHLGNTMPAYFDNEAEAGATWSFFRYMDDHAHTLTFTEFSMYDCTTVKSTSVRPDLQKSETWFKLDYSVAWHTRHQDGSPGYSVTGDHTFYIRKCADDKYRIVHWTEHNSSA